MNQKEQIAEQILRKHLGNDYAWLKGNGPLSKVLAAIIEAMSLTESKNLTWWNKVWDACMEGGMKDHEGSGLEQVMAFLESLKPKENNGKIQSAPTNKEDVASDSGKQ